MSHQLWNPCRTYNISPNQMYLISCYYSKISPGNVVNEKAEALICQAKGLLGIDNKLTEKGIAVLNEFETMLVKTKKKVDAEVLGPEFLEKVKEYREIFPSKRIPPHNELARQNTKTLKDNFVWFFKNYPEYSWELVLEATDYYVYCKSRENFEYMMTSSHFIKKTDPNKVVISKLADYCEMIKEDRSLLQQIPK